MVHWFPGQMAKTQRLIVENIKMVDVVLELADARLPASSRNPLLLRLTEHKPRLLVLSKADLAEAPLTRQWLDWFRSQGEAALALDALKGGREAKKELLESIRELARNVMQKRKQKGIINETVRTMVLGIPNVGKSTLINFLAGKTAAEAADKPGVTRGKQWIKLGLGVELLDMPGILWPKIEEEGVGYKLAATGAVRDQVFDQVEVVCWLLEWLVKNKPGRLANRYGLEELEDHSNAGGMLARISSRRGYLRSGGEPDLSKGAAMVLDELRGGKLGAITMDLCRPRSDSEEKADGEGGDE